MKLQRLRELAIGTTPNQWKLQDLEIVASNRFVIAKAGSPDHRLKGKEWHEENAGCKANAAYIAAACPANILPFLESYEELLAASKAAQSVKANIYLERAITNAEKLNYE